MNDVFKILKDNWPLFFGLSMIMIGNGLQGTLLGVRASIEGFSYIWTGVIMSSYFGGYFFGCMIVPGLVKNVGHIRVFTALASLASASVLFNGVFINPVTWTIVRLISGLAYAGMFIVVESWLNDISNNKVRGKLMGAYIISGFGSMFFGQFLMNVAPPEEVTLFILTSVLVSIALVPIALSKRPAPEIQTPEPLSLLELYNISPTAVVGVFIAGVVGAAIMTIGPVYALDSGMSISQISLFIAIYILGGVLGQIPIGQLSDKIGRRPTILVVCVATIFMSVLCALFSRNYYVLLALFALLGFFAASLYPVCAAYTNDHLKKEQFIAASSRVIIVSGMGSLTGPLLASVSMMVAGPDAFFWFITASFVIYTAIVFGRTLIAPALPIKQQGEYMAMPSRITPMTPTLVNEDLQE